MSSDVTMTRPAFLAVSGPAAPSAMGIVVLDDSLYQAPTTVLVVVEDGEAEGQVHFEIDGDSVLVADLDSDGRLGPLSVPVSAAHGAIGSHTIEVVADTGPATSATAAFVLEKGPNVALGEVGPDAAPVDVPGSVLTSGVRRWVFQDLLAGGLGSYIFPTNPTSTDPWPFGRTLNQQPVLNGDKVHVSDIGPETHEWSFRGFSSSVELYQAFLDFGALDRRFYLIDHRGRAWVYVINDPDLVPRRRVVVNGIQTDWAFDYTIHGLLYGNEWQVPE